MMEEDGADPQEPAMVAGLAGEAAAAPRARGLSALWGAAALRYRAEVTQTVLCWWQASTRASGPGAFFVVMDPQQEG